MALVAPPGLNASDPESSTVSRERRRVALAAKAAVGELSGAVLELLREQQAAMNVLQSKMDTLLSQSYGAKEWLPLSKATTTPLCEMVEELVTKHVHVLIEQQADKLKLDMHSGFEQLTINLELMSKRIKPSCFPSVDARRVAGVDLREPESETSPSKFTRIDEVRGAGATRCELFNLFEDGEATCEKELEEENCDKNNDPIVEQEGLVEKTPNDRVPCHDVMDKVFGIWRRNAMLNHVSNAELSAGTDEDKKEEEVVPDDEYSATGSDGEASDDPIVEAFTESLVDSFVDGTNNREHLKSLLLRFVRGRIARGYDRATAVREGMDITKYVVALWKDAG